MYSLRVCTIKSLLRQRSRVWSQSTQRFLDLCYLRICSRRIQTPSLSLSLLFFFFHKMCHLFFPPFVNFCWSSALLILKIHNVLFEFANSFMTRLNKLAGTWKNKKQEPRHRERDRGVHECVSKEEHQKIKNNQKTHCLHAMALCVGNNFCFL